MGTAQLPRNTPLKPLTLEIVCQTVRLECRILARPAYHTRTWRVAPATRALCLEVGQCAPLSNREPSLSLVVAPGT